MAQGIHCILRFMDIVLYALIIAKAAMILTATPASKVSTCLLIVRIASKAVVSSANKVQAQLILSVKLMFMDAVQ